VKALSLYQPWASAMAAGIKTIETRGWSTDYRGELAIHAAKRWAGDQLQFWIDTIMAFPEIEAAFARIGIRHYLDLPFGKIVTRVNLVHVASTSAAPPDYLRTSISPYDQVLGDFGPGRFAWFTTRNIPLAEPIAVIGRQTLFDWPEGDHLFR
jgi:hypothetical protein